MEANVKPGIFATISDAIRAQAEDTSIVFGYGGTAETVRFDDKRRVVERFTLQEIDIRKLPGA